MVHAVGQPHRDRRRPELARRGRSRTGCARSRPLARAGVGVGTGCRTCRRSRRRRWSTGCPGTCSSSWRRTRCRAASAWARSAAASSARVVPRHVEADRRLAPVSALQGGDVVDLLVGRAGLAADRGTGRSGCRRCRPPTTAPPPRTGPPRRSRASPSTPVRATTSSGVGEVALVPGQPELVLLGDAAAVDRHRRSSPLTVGTPSVRRRRPARSCRSCSDRSPPSSANTAAATCSGSTSVLEQRAPGVEPAELLLGHAVHLGPLGAPAAGEDARAPHHAVGVHAVDPHAVLARARRPAAGPGGPGRPWPRRRRRCRARRRPRSSTRRRRCRPASPCATITRAASRLTRNEPRAITSCWQVPVVDGRLEQRLGDRQAGVVDHEVDAAVGGGRRLDRARPRRPRR